MGKSSLTAAIDCIKRNKLDVPIEFKPQQDEKKSSILEITIDGRTYRADSASNYMSSTIGCYTIHCDIYVKTTSRNVGNRYQVAAGHLAVTSIDVMGKVPPRAEIKYGFNEVKRKFGENGKILTNIDDECINALNSFDVKKCIALIEEVLHMQEQSYSAYVRRLRTNQEYVFYRIRRNSQRRLPTSLHSISRKSSHASTSAPTAERTANEKLVTVPDTTTSTQNNPAHGYLCKIIVTIPAHHADSHYFCVANLMRRLIGVKIKGNFLRAFTQADLM